MFDYNRDVRQSPSRRSPEVAPEPFPCGKRNRGTRVEKDLLHNISFPYESLRPLPLEPRGS